MNHARVLPAFQPVGFSTGLWAALFGPVFRALHDLGKKAHGIFLVITQAMCTSFKLELLQGTHNFNLTGGDTFKIALYTSTATLGASTTAYSATNEISGTGYTAGGNTLTRIDPTSTGTTAFADFADTSWSGASFTARGALIYNSTDANRAVAVLDFGADKTVSGGTFTLQFPTADATNAILRIS